VIAQVSMRSPGSVGNALHLMMGGEAALCANKAKRRLCRQPCKPGWRLGFEGEQPKLRADHDVMPIAARLDSR
jgi:hypothetical protein